MAYVSIRRYEGIIDFDEVVRRAAEGFVPIISGTPGYIAYHIIDAGGGVAASISIFESQAGAEESTRRAAAWVKENLAQLIPNPPQVTAGEARVSHQK
jgi:hypothetical protein